MTMETGMTKTVGVTPLDQVRAMDGLTLIRDLTSGIIAGCLLAALFALILRRAVPEEGEGEEAGA